MTIQKAATIVNGQNFSLRSIRKNCNSSIALQKKYQCDLAGEGNAMLTVHSFVDQF